MDPEVFADRFKYNTGELLEILFGYVMEASEKKMISVEPEKVGMFLEVARMTIKNTDPEVLIDKFITHSKNELELSGADLEYRSRGYPELWKVLLKLPSPAQLEENIPLPPDVDHFLLHDVTRLFPIAQKFHPHFQKVYTHVENGQPFLTEEDKRYVSSYFYALTILATKYVNARRQPVIRNNRMVRNEMNGDPQYTIDYRQDLRVRSVCQYGGIDMDSLLV